MSNRLDAGQTLAPMESLVASNGAVSLDMQEDGNLVLYDMRHGRLPIWHTHTEGNFGSRADMQADGNFVVYAPDGTPLSATETDGNLGAYLLVQDDMNVVVYSADGGTALWASGTMLRRAETGFSPAQHGFHFSNRFINKVATLPGGGQIETYGRCGGMAYAALDYYHSGLPVPAFTAADFAPDGVPPDGHWLADYIYRRLIDSFMNNSALQFPKWTLHKEVTHWTKEDEFPKLMQSIDEGNPVVLGLIRATDLANIGENHQVVASKYEYHQKSRYAWIYLYDNNHPDVETVMHSSLATPHWTMTTGESWRGFFVHSYQHSNPPV